jgi:two-component system cell cycle response regulator
MAMTHLYESLPPDENVRPSAVVPKDEDWTRRISSVMPGKVAERIVVVSADPTLLRKPCQALERDGYELSFASPEAFVEIAPQLDMDLVLVDMTQDPTAAVHLCRAMRQSHASCHLTIVLLANRESDEDFIASALLEGADDCIVLGRRTKELLARVRVQLRNKGYRDALTRVRGERDQFRNEASLDALTHLPNRKALLNVLRDCIERQQPFAALFLDLDHFKMVNDELGHAMGDAVLRAASACLKQHARSNDFCSRFGGEEFVLLLEGANGVEALRAADRHRRALEELSIEHARGVARITASVGIAVWDPERPVPMDDLLAMADAALYEAKRSGRNRALLASPTLEATGSDGA